MGELSNTATPKYYGIFREKVIRGEIPVNEKISMQMNRIDDNIRNPGVYYDGELVEGFIRFCENEMVLTDGTNFEMLDSFKLWAEDLFGWYYFEERSVWVPMGNGKRGKFIRKRIKKRLINKQFLIVGRGASKSLYESFIQAYELVIDRSTTQQVTTAPTVRQAEEVLAPIKTALTISKGPLFKLLTSGSIQNTTGSKANRPKLCSTKKGIENFITNSIIEIRPMRIDKFQGLRSKVITIDEWLSNDIHEDVTEAAEQSASKIQDWILVAVSSEGTVRNGPGDTIKMELMDILKGEYINPHVSIWWYCLDDVSEVADPSLWIKANPNIGLTVTYETYQLAVEKAEKVPTAKNDILAKRFGIPCEGYTYFFTYEETLKSRKRDYWGMACALGADLSQGDDFCAFTFLFPLRREMFGIKARSYITTRTFMKLPMAMRNKYNELIDEGSLIVMEGTTLKMDEVYDDLDQYITDNDYDVCAFGYDPYNAKEFVERYEKENSSRGVLMVRQGVRTESVPLGEIKNLAEDKKLVFDQEIMTFTMGNAIVLKDSNNNKKLYKKRNDMKIDNVAALLDAYVAYKANIEDFE